MRFLKNTANFVKIWLTQIVRNKITNLLVQSDFDKSGRVFQKTNFKIELLQSNVVQPKTKCYSLM